jgi:hypothetical protein
VKETRGSTPAYFYYDGDRLLCEYSHLGAKVRYYVDGPTYIDEHVMMKELGVEYYYLQGPMHTVLGLADPNGQLASSYRYNAYGSRVAPEATVLPAPAVLAEGCRSLKITPPPGNAPVALKITPLCGADATTCQGGQRGTAKYVAAPSGSRNIASVGDVKYFRTLAQWLPQGASAAHATGSSSAPTLTAWPRCAATCPSGPPRSFARPPTDQGWYPSPLHCDLESTRWFPLSGSTNIGSACMFPSPGQPPSRLLLTTTVVLALLPTERSL